MADLHLQTRELGEIHITQVDHAEGTRYRVNGRLYDGPDKLPPSIRRLLGMEADGPSPLPPKGEERDGLATVGAGEIWDDADREHLGARHRALRGSLARALGLVGYAGLIGFATLWPSGAGPFIFLGYYLGDLLVGLAEDFLGHFVWLDRPLRASHFLRYLGGLLVVGGLHFLEGAFATGRAGWVSGEALFLVVLFTTLWCKGLALAIQRWHLKVERSLG